MEIGESGAFGRLAAGFLLMDQLGAGAKKSMDLSDLPASLVRFTVKSVIPNGDPMSNPVNNMN